MASMVKKNLHYSTNEPSQLLRMRHVLVTHQKFSNKDQKTQNSVFNNSVENLCRPEDIRGLALQRIITKSHSK